MLLVWGSLHLLRAYGHNRQIHQASAGIVQPCPFATARFCLFFFARSPVLRFAVPRVYPSRDGVQKIFSKYSWSRDLLS